MIRTALAWLRQTGCHPLASENDTTEDRTIVEDAVRIAHDAPMAERRFQRQALWYRQVSPSKNSAQKNASARSCGGSAPRPNEKASSSNGRRVTCVARTRGPSSASRWRRAISAAVRLKRGARPARALAHIRVALGNACFCCVPASAASQGAGSEHARQSPAEPAPSTAHLQRFERTRPTRPRSRCRRARA